MITILPKNKKVKNITPYYELVYNYMIGDSDGDTTHVCEVSLDNTHVERFVKLVNSLKPTKGTWGIIFDENFLEKAHEEGQINEDDYEFLSKIQDCDFEDDKEAEYAEELSEGIRSEASYSFLVFEGVDLYYYDDKGVKYNTEIVN